MNDRDDQPDRRPGTTPAPTFDVLLCDADIAVLTVSGEQDVTAKPQLDEALAQATTRAGVLVDLSGCGFIDSSMIGVIVTAYRHLRDRNGRLELVVPLEARAIRRTMEIMGLPAILTIHPSRSAGLASLQRQP
jgi:anti-sigma B factor antagonist